MANGNDTTMGSAMDSAFDDVQDDIAVNKNTLVSDLRVVLADAQEMLRSAAATTGEKAQQLRERAAVNLRLASEKLVDLQAAAVDRSKAAARYTDDYVHENPWKAIGIAAAIGFLLGLAANRN